MVKKDDKPIIQSVDRALNILDLVAGYPELSITKIAEEMELSKSTVFGLVATLRKHGFIEQNPDTQQYRLGVRFFELYSKAQARLDFREIALPFMRKLSQEYNETVSLVVLDGAEVVYIECLQAYNVLSLRFNAGARLPANCTATGKCLLSNLSDEDIDDLFRRNPIQGLTPSSVTDIEVLKGHLKMVREDGYAYDNEEAMFGVAGVAACVRDFRGNTIAALSMGGPIAQFTGDRKEELRKALLKTAAAVSAELGYRPHVNG